MTRLTPLEIQRSTFPGRFRGYDPGAVRELLNLLAQQVEDDNRQRGELKSELARLRAEIDEYRQRTETLSEALVSAQRAAEATVAQAQDRAQQIVMDAEALADRVLAEAAHRTETIELITTQLRDRRRSARADVKRIAELLLGLARDDERSEQRDAEPPKLALMRPRESSGKSDR